MGTITGITDKIGNAINAGGTVVDQVSDVVPVVGTIVGDLGAGGMKIVAGAFKSGGHLLEGNAKKAAEEAVVGLTKGAVTAVPLVEKAELAGFSVEDMAEKQVRGMMAPSEVPNVQGPSSNIGHVKG